MASRNPDRKIIQTKKARFETYDLDGKLEPEMALLPLSFDRKTRVGTYLMQMDPGAETTEHTHAHREEFMILQGDLIENDGTVLGPGDYVCFAPGTRHNSRTKDGCLLIVFEWKN